MLSKANGQSLELVLTRFALERLLFRLSRSRHAESFVLKGAMLMMSWFDDRRIDLVASEVRDQNKPSRQFIPSVRAVANSDCCVRAKSLEWL